MADVVAPAAPAAVLERAPDTGMDPFEEAMAQAANPPTEAAPPADEPEKPTKRVAAKRKTKTPEPEPTEDEAEELEAASIDPPDDAEEEDDDEEDEVLQTKAASKHKVKANGREFEYTTEELKKEVQRLKGAERAWVDLKKTRDDMQALQSGIKAALQSYELPELYKAFGVDFESMRYVLAVLADATLVENPDLDPAEQQRLQSYIMDSVKRTRENTTKAERQKAAQAQKLQLFDQIGTSVMERVGGKGASVVPQLIGRELAAYAKVGLDPDLEGVVAGVFEHTKDAFWSLAEKAAETDADLDDLIPEAFQKRIAKRYLAKNKAKMVPKASSAAGVKQKGTAAGPPRALAMTADQAMQKFASGAGLTDDEAAAIWQ